MSVSGKITRQNIRSFFALLVVVAMLTGLDACSTSYPSVGEVVPAEKPIIVRPVSVPPAPRPRQEIASWYGPGFNGHITSTGERYNENAMTAASKTLPLGSRVRVTNPENGRSVEVRINDRGPHKRGRTLDLSKRAAEKLGIAKKGVARVEVTPATPKSRSAIAKSLPPAVAHDSSAASHI